MILVDTSIWVDHLAKGVRALAELLERSEGDHASATLSPGARIWTRDRRFAAAIREMDLEFTGP